MLTRISAGRLVALMLVVALAVALAASQTSPARAAQDKPYRRDDLAATAIKLEAEVRAQQPAPRKPLAALRSDADKAQARKDWGTLVALLRAIAAQAPQDGATWLRLAKAMVASPPAPEAGRDRFFANAAAAAYLAYQRAAPGGLQSGTLEADALSVIGTSYAAQAEYRPALDALHASLDLREDIEVRDQYDKLRTEHGFRILNYSVDADTAAPRACFQFSESLPGGSTDFLPFVSVAGQDKPALSVDDTQLCVEGLLHGERYQVTLRAGLPSTVRETLLKAAEYSLYVPDRSPSVRFTTRAYVLPRSGQRGIPLVSINTAAIALKVYRIGDRNLLSAVVAGNFQQSLERYQLQELADERGTLVWSGEMAVESPLNAEVTTAFPVDEAIGSTLAPGVYVLAAEAARGGNKDDDAGALATQWFVVSDLGLQALSGADGIHVFVNSLATTEPSAGAEIRLVARNNEVLATRRTDASGHVLFEHGLARGDGGLSPALVVATGSRDDYAFLSLKGQAFDFSDRGTGGRAAPAGLDAFIYAERGVYRTGETVHLTALVRDTAATATAGVPLTLVVERPDGLEYRRAVVADQGAGGRSLDVALASSAATGTWTVNAYADPKRPAIGSTTFLVEDYMPDRTEFTLTGGTTTIVRGRPFEVSVAGRFLYGAPASALELTGTLTVQPAPGRPGFDGYQFGTGSSPEPVETTLENLPATDAAGKARFNVTVDRLPDTNQPLQAQVTIAMAEAGGRAVERRLTLPVAPATAMIGVRQRFQGGDLRENDTATFDAVVVAPEGTAVAARGLRWELFKIEHRYQWYRSSGHWSFDAVKQTKKIASGSLDTASDQPGRIAVPVEWGRYRLEVSTPDRSIPATTVDFDAGFFGGDTADTPDLLETALDKEAYAAGDDMTVAVTAKTQGVVRLNVVTDRLVATRNEKVRPGVNRVHVPVGRDWGNGGYVVATFLRPLDEAQKHMPGRAIGVRWFSVDRKARTLAVAMTPEPQMRPGARLTVPVRIDGVAGGEARVVVAAVDVGILNLTNYKPPAPEDYYLGQRRLAAEVRDLYGQLIDGMQGTRGQIRSGGDGLARFGARPPAGPPLALYSGIVTVAPDGTAEVGFDIPAFAGTVRLMAVAWSHDRVGHGTADVIVRDPVVATVTLPRFILAGDRSTMQIEVDNVDGPAGDYQVAVDAAGPVAAGAPPPTVKLAARERKALSVPLTATAVGDGDLKVTVTGPDHLTLARSYHLAAKPATEVLTRRTVRTIAPGESVTLTADVFADLVPGTGSVALSAGPSTALDAAALLSALDRYPFGCSEQLTSKTLPLLYTSELSATGVRPGDDARVRDAIERLMTRQDSTGSFGLWQAGSGEDPWLDSYVTEFLTRARERGFAVPEAGFKLALDRLRNFAVNAPAPTADKDGGRALAYAFYVLARNGMAPVGDLRYLADARLTDIVTPIARAQIGAALGIMGDRVRADRLYASAFTVPVTGTRFEDYGSRLRDAAAVMTLEAEGSAPQAVITAAIAEIEAARAATGLTSTQENAWMVMAAHALGRSGQVSLDAGGEAVTRPLYRTLPAAAVAAQPFKVTNTGTAELRAVVSVSGAPVVPEPPAAKGFRIERRYYTLDGKPADPARARQNQQFAVVLKVTEEAPQYGRVMLADYLPAGFEIENPRLVSSGETGALPWITDAVAPAHAEFRDDHFAAAFDRGRDSAPVFTVAYVVRAVSPGTYVLPQARVEDMYRPDRFGRTATATATVTAAR